MGCREDVRRRARRQLQVHLRPGPAHQRAKGLSGYRDAKARLPDGERYAAGERALVGVSVRGMGLMGRMGPMGPISPNLRLAFVQIPVTFDALMSRFPLFPRLLVLA